MGQVTGGCRPLPGPRQSGTRIESFIGSRIDVACRPEPLVPEGFPHEVPTDHDPLDLSCSFPDLADLGVSHHPLHGVVLGVPHPPEELNGLGRDPHAKLRTVELRHGGFLPEGPTLILKPGGMIVLEAYTPAQLEFRTGGPHTVELMMTLDALREELAGLEIVRGEELERVVREGEYHDGKGAVVQVLARKPR